VRCLGSRLTGQSARLGYKHTCTPCGCAPAEPDSSPAAAGKTCQVNSDCKSGSCVDERCAEAKYCASRFLYDNLGANIQQRTFDGHLHQDPIKCGQCVCQDCPVSSQPRRLPSAHRPASLLYSALSRPVGAQRLAVPQDPDQPARRCVAPMPPTPLPRRPAPPTSRPQCVSVQPPYPRAAQAAGLPPES
jgi:hypothetical protein